MIELKLEGYKVMVTPYGHTVIVSQDSPVKLPDLMGASLELSVDSEQRLVMTLQIPESKQVVRFAWEELGGSYLTNGGWCAPIWINDESLQSLVGRVKVALNRPL